MPAKLDQQSSTGSAERATYRVQGRCIGARISRSLCQQLALGRIPAATSVWHLTYRRSACRHSRPCCRSNSSYGDDACASAFPASPNHPMRQRRGPKMMPQVNRRGRSGPVRKLLQRKGRVQHKTPPLLVHVVQLRLTQTTWHTYHPISKKNDDQHPIVDSRR